MKKTEIITALIHIVSKETGLSIESVNQDTQLIGGGVNLNSMKILKLIMAVENHFAISFKTDALTENYFDTVDTLSELINLTIEDEASIMS